MQLPNTERLHEKAEGLDAMPLNVAAVILAEGQVAASQSVPLVGAQLQAAALSMAATIRAGASLYYVAAGSSGLMAASDAMELGGTFGISASQVKILMAGGVPTTAEMPGDTEDSTAELEAGLKELGEKDTVIAVSASGSTPFTMEAVRIANACSASVVGIANNQGSALLEASDHPICLQTPPEVISGSTRLGAGTAQKIALNTLSTLMAIDLGDIHDGMMVNVRADNEKLRERALRIVQTISGVDENAAASALHGADGNVKPAVLIAAGAKDAVEAATLLNDANGRLRPALRRLETET